MSGNCYGKQLPSEEIASPNESFCKSLKSQASGEMKKTARFTEKVFREMLDSLEDEVFKIDKDEEPPMSASREFRLLSSARKSSIGSHHQLISSFVQEDLQQFGWMHENESDDLKSKASFEIYEDNRSQGENAKDREDDETTSEEKRKVLADITPDFLVESFEHIEDVGFLGLEEANIYPVEISNPKKNQDESIELRSGSFAHIFTRTGSPTRFLTKMKWLEKTEEISETSLNETPKRSSHGSKIWSRLRPLVQEGNKENEPGADFGTYFSNVVQLLKNWKKSGTQVEQNQHFEALKVEHDSVADRLKREFKLKREEITENSTRSLENFKIKIDTLKLEYQYKRNLKADLRSNSPEKETERSPIKESRYFSNRADVEQQEENGNNSLVKDNNKKLEIIDNKLKLRLIKPVPIIDSFEALCDSENIPKVETLRRMRDGSIKKRRAQKELMNSRIN